MKTMNGRLVVIAGVALALAGLLAFSLATPSTALGGEEGTGLQTDVDLPTTTISADDANVSVGGQTNVTVNIVDGAGNPVAGTECTFSITSQPGTDASVDAGPVTTDANGDATTTVQVGSTEGQIDVEATCGGETVTVSVVAGAGAGGAAAPPASLPAAGAEGVSSTGGSASTLLVMLLAALGVTLTGAGLIAVRNRQQATDD